MRRHNIHMPPDTQAAFPEELARHVARFGDGRASHTRPVAAAHEAGHVLVTHILGMKPSLAEIWRDSDGHWVGYSERSVHGAYHVGNEPQRALGEIMFLLSGVFGEWEIANFRDTGSSADEVVQGFMLADNFAAVHGVDPLALRIVLTTRAVLLIREHITAARRLRDELQMMRRLRRPRLRTLLQSVPILGCRAVGGQILAMLDDTP